MSLNFDSKSLELHFLSNYLNNFVYFRPKNIFAFTNYFHFLQLNVLSEFHFFLWNQISLFSSLIKKQLQVFIHLKNFKSQIILQRWKSGE